MRLFQSLLFTASAVGFSLVGAPAAHGGEVELKSLNTLANDPVTKPKYGPYVGFFGGENSNQSATVTIGGLNYNMDDRDGSGIVGIEVGKSFRAKKWPVMASLEFEGSFLSTSVNGQADEATMAVLANNGLATYETDMNAVFFMVNGSISLDLWRYRARIGKVLAGLKPYVGAGFGGGQTWFRNTATQSKDQFTGANPATLSGSTPFAMDEFISAWQWFGGVEYAWKDKYSVFAEFREFHFGELEELTEFTTKGYALGFRYRY